MSVCGSGHTRVDGLVPGQSLCSSPRIAVSLPLASRSQRSACGWASRCDRSCRTNLLVAKSLRREYPQENENYERDTLAGKNLWHGNINPGNAGRQGGPEKQRGPIVRRRRAGRDTLLERTASGRHQGSLNLVVIGSPTAELKVFADAFNASTLARHGGVIAANHSSYDFAPICGVGP
jgi:hypothetical protein